MRNHIKMFEEFIPLGTDFDYWIKTLNKLGYNITDKLSGGHYGFCYLTDNKKVIKVSFHRGDALAAHKLKNLKNEYLEKSVNNKLENFNLKKDYSFKIYLFYLLFLYIF